MAPKHKCSDAASASKSKRSRDVLSISEKVKILDMIEVRKNRMRRLPGCVARTKKHDFYCLCSALMEKHYFYCNVIS